MRRHRDGCGHASRRFRCRSAPRQKPRARRSCDPRALSSHDAHLRRRRTLRCQHDITLCDSEALVSPAEREAWERCREDSHAAEHHRGHEQGTVGAVALDEQGRLFAATSTGGTCCKLPGRVGDSPLIGCGCYADRETGAVSATGYGEAIMKVVMAKTACDFLRPANSTPARAAQAAVQLLANRAKGTGGLILLDKNGNPGFAFNTPRMSYGFVNPDGSFFAAV